VTKTDKYDNVEEWDDELKKARKRTAIMPGSTNKRKRNIFC
jgi:hypothetical protein